MLLEIDASSADLNADTVREAMEGQGVLILRNAFDLAEMPAFAANIAEFRDEVVASIEEERPARFEDWMVFKENTLSCVLFALDPATKDLHIKNYDTDFDDVAAELAARSNVIEQVLSCPAWPVIAESLPPNPVFQGGRARVVHKSAGHSSDLKGGVALHQEKWVLRRQAVPVGHNMWTLLNTDGAVANRDMPGLQFVLGDRDFWREPVPEDHDIYIENVRPRILRLNGLCRRTADNLDDLVEIDGHTVYRPKLKAGDIALFDHHIPHGSFYPAQSTHTRVSCELRVFPRDPSFSGLKI